jgi:hypothetical protein
MTDEPVRCEDGLHDNILDHDRISMVDTMWIHAKAGVTGSV